MSEAYDAIVIGAGHNGLTAAAYLARAGKKTLLLESRQTAGGAASNEESFPGCRVDIGAHEAGLLRPAVIRELGLEQRGATFQRGLAAAFAPLPDDRSLTLWRDSRQTLKEIEAHSASDARLFEDYSRRLFEMASALDALIDLTPPRMHGASTLELLPWLKSALKIKRKSRILMDLLRTLPMSAKEFLDEWFDCPALKGLLGAAGVTGGLVGPQASGTAFMLVYQSLGQGLCAEGFRSTVFVKGGMGSLIDALVRAATDFGAEVRVNARVTSLLRRESGVAGVELEDGQELRARAVVSSLDPRRTFFELAGGQAVMPREMRKIRAFRFRGGAAKLNLLLDEPPCFRSRPEGLSHLTGRIIVAPDLDYLERASDEAKYGDFSHRPYLEAVVPTLLDPDRAPQGKHLMSVIMHHAPYRLREGDWETRKEELESIIIGTLAQHAPRLPDSILDRRLLTPRDWERDFGLSEGSMFQGQMGLDQLFLLRPFAGYARYRTPLVGLYLCGSATHPGGGVTGAPGRNAAREVLSDLRKAG